MQNMDGTDMMYGLRYLYIMINQEKLRDTIYINQLCW